jgi:hypothetical protein
MKYFGALIAASTIVLAVVVELMIFPPEAQVNDPAAQTLSSAIWFVGGAAGLFIAWLLVMRMNARARRLPAVIRVTAETVAPQH